MSKNPGELTVAIRQLCDETDGAITHSEARPRLEKLGFEIAPEPGRKSPEFAKWDEYEVNYDDPASIQSVAAACGFDEKTTKRMVKEHESRVAYDLERNTFNVAKYNWKKAKESGRPTASRPAKVRNQKSQVAKRPGRKAAAVVPAPVKRPGRKIAQAEPDFGMISEMVALVQKHGSVDACNKRVAELQAEIQQAQEEIDSLKRAVEVVNAAAKAA